MESRRSPKEQPGVRLPQRHSLSTQNNTNKRFSPCSAVPCCRAYAGTILVFSGHPASRSRDASQDDLAPRRASRHTANPQPLLALDTFDGSCNRGGDGRGFGLATVALLLPKPPTTEPGALQFYGFCSKKTEPTSGLEPLTCSLRVIDQTLQGVA